MSDILGIIKGGNRSILGGGGAEASDIEYDNTTSGLTTDNVQDAIDELVGKIDKGSISVTADGVKTYGEIFNALCLLIDDSKIGKNTTLSIEIEQKNATIPNGQYFNLVRWFNIDHTQYPNVSNAYYFAFSYYDGTSNLYVVTAQLLSLGSSKYGAAAGAFDTLDYSNNVPPSGAVFTITY